MAQPLIVIVDDNLSDVYLLGQAIRERANDVELQFLSDGEAAIQFLVTQASNSRKRHPCLILLDLHLPKYDGLEVLRTMRERPALDHIQVIVMTGAASPSVQDELVRLGTGCRPKPASLAEFDALAAELIERCKSASEAAA